MVRVSSALASAVLAGALAACSAPPPAPPAAIASTAPMPAQPAAAGTSSAIAGTYRAPPGGATGNSACGTTRFSYPIRVANGVASMQTVTQGRLEGPVGPDGSLNIQSGNASLSGQFNGGRFDGTYSVRSCALTLHYTK